ncbi:MAG: hypothetical protein A3B53_02195 [Candidatus Levybacteria bacterium RIFCSPLOWO2_01_FULL_42_15]|nr:MAG: hypothetical protein A3B53_02195 [Candidatus Levybacteria bacterium RIFCSPLOWO2_01_FULL_42_15]
MKTVLGWITVLLIFFIFKNWFTAPFITAGDFPHFFNETIAQWSIIPPSWNPTNGNGFGGEHLLYALDSYIYFLGGFMVNRIGLPWEVVYKFFVFGLFIILSVYSSIYLLKKTLENPRIFQMIIGVLLFLTNTYIFMIVGGGQMGVALAYSIAPLVLTRFIMIIQNSDFATQGVKSRIKQVLLASFVLAVQIMFDARLALLTLAVTLAYLFFFILTTQLNKKIIIKKIVSFFSVIFLGLLFHLSWILPRILFGATALEGLIKNSTEGVLRNSFEFFSFAQFPQTVSFLHPNWPENIFGKIYFMNPEFLALPILAFSSLFFIKKNSHKKNNQIIIFFALLGLIGAFLAKGANPPFEEINVSIFMHMPASEIFRDSTKFYLFIALSYTVLIPFSVHNIYNFFKTKFNVPNKKVHILNYIPCIFLFFVFLFLLFLIRPIFLDELRGTFKQYEMPKEYIELKDFLVEKPTFFRTLWLPTQHRFNFYSLTHPATSAKELFTATNSAEIIMQLHDEKTKDYLMNLAIQYIIVPYDSFGEIFVRDRKYNEKEYEDTSEGLKKISWLEKLEGFEKIGVYKITQKASDHFRLYGEGNISYEMRKPDRYDISISVPKPSKLIFVENYNPYWIAKLGKNEIKSEKTEDNLNSFAIEKSGSYSGEIYSSKQEAYNYGQIASLVMLTTFIVSLFML